MIFNSTWYELRTILAAYNASSRNAFTKRTFWNKLKIIEQNISRSFSSYLTLLIGNCLKGSGESRHCSQFSEDSIKRPRPGNVAYFFYDKTT